MVTDTNLVKLIDFGLSKNASKKELLQSMTGTPYYMAPEIFEDAKYDKAVDIWSLGVVLFTCLGGYRPFNGKNLKEISKNILECNYKFHPREWSSISRDAKDLIGKMLTRDPTKRITAEKALKHPWFGLITEIKLESTLKKEQKVKSKTMKKLCKFSQGSPLKRCAMELLIKMLSLEEKQVYEQEFNKFDTTRSGVVSDRDFISKIQETDVSLSRKEVKRITKELDYDENSQINYSDFIAATLDVKKCLTKDKLQTIFSKFDTTNSNKITAEDIMKALDAYGFAATQHQ